MNVNTLIRKCRINDHQLTKLRLSGVGDISGSTPIGPEATAALAAALRHNNKCTEMDFSGNEASDVGAHQIAQALSTNTSLTSLDLSWSEIGHRGASSIAKFLGGYSDGVKSVHGVDAIVLNSGRGWGNSTLTYLNLGCNKLGDRGAVALAPALAQLVINQSRRRRKQGNSVAAASSEACDYGYRASMLAYLDLRSNGIGALGAATLAAAIARNNTLTTLDMQGNRFETHPTRTSSLTALNLIA